MLFLQDTSLVSVSPIPIEAYLTPRKTSGQVDERSFDEETADSAHEDESLSTTVETKDEELVSPSQEEEAQLPESETSIVEVEIDNRSPVSIKDEDVIEDEVLSVNDTQSESPSHIELPSEGEQVSSIAHQNGDLELEEGELVGEAEDEDDEEMETEGAETENAEDETGEKDHPPKGKIQYDREFLMKVGAQVKQTKPTVPVLSDVAKTPNNVCFHHLLFYYKSIYATFDLYLLFLCR